MKRFLAVVLILAQLASGAWAENYGTTPTLDIPKLGEGNWGTKISNAFKSVSDFLSVSLNSDGSPKAGVTASQWQLVTTSVTYVSASSFSVSSSHAAQFEAGRKVWLSQSTDVIGTVVSASTVGGTTTVTLDAVVLYSDNFTASVVASPITNVSVSLVTPRSSTAPPLGAFRNKVINGSMDVWQRATTYALTTSIVPGSVDRFFVYQQTAANGIANRDSSAPTGFRYSLKLGRTASSSSTNPISTGQIVETANSIPLQGKPVTLSFYAKAGANFSATSNNLIVRLGTGTGTDQAASSFIGAWTGPVTAINATQSITTSWTRYQFTATLGASITQVGFDVSYAPTGTAGADDNVYLTGFQLEPGASATSFEYRPVSQETYFCRTYYAAGARVLLTDRATSGSSTWGVMRFFPVSMRATPTVVISAQGGTTGQARYNGTVANATVTDISTESFSYSFSSTASGLNANDAVSTDCSYTANAEF